MKYCFPTEKTFYTDLAVVHSEMMDSIEWHMQYVLLFMQRLEMRENTLQKHVCAVEKSLEGSLRRGGSGTGSGLFSGVLEGAVGVLGAHPFVPFSGCF